MKILLAKINYYDQLIEVLFKNSSAIWATNILAPLGIAYILKGFIEDYLLISFIFIQLLLGAYRFYIGKIGLNALKNKNKKLINNSLKQYLSIIFINSTLFGIICYLTVLNAGELEVFVMLALLFGLTSGSFSTLSCIYHAIVFYIVPFTTIFIVALALSGNDIYYIIAITLLFYMIITLPSSYRIYLTLKTNIDKAKIISTQKEEIMLNQTQLIHSAKMASMGEMMANIAHQWRQPLSSISSTASSIKLTNSLGMEQSPKELDKNMGIILSKTQYLSDTIDTFRDFIKENKEIKKVSLQDRLEIIEQIVNTSLKNNHIQFKHNYNKFEPIILNMVIGELDQVIINIINNAKDALLENKPKNPHINLELKKIKDIVQISIEDNGGGIPKEIIEKVFEPYFSTKHQSQGTGLGLHMSYKIIVESLKGKLYVKNTQKGAKFYIELPL